MKKRQISFGLLCFALALSSAGCSKQETSNESSDAITSSETIPSSELETSLETPPSSDTLLGVPLSLNGEKFTTINDVVEILREEPIYATNSTNSTVVATLAAGTQVQRIASGSTFSAIVYNNQICYVDTLQVKSAPDATIETLSVSDLHINLEQFQQIAGQPSAEESENSAENSPASEEIASPVETEENVPVETSAVTQTAAPENAASEGAATVETPASGTVGAVMPDLASLSTLDNTAIPWGYSKTDRNELNQPNGCLYFDRLYGSYNADFYRKDSSNVYLTMDEGYENGLTPQILDTLAEKNVKAVFFITYDFAVQNPDLVKRMINEGHIVGNHSYTHPSGGIPTLEDINAQYNEFMINHNYVLENYGYEMYLFRFPEGCFSVRSLALAQSLGYRSVFWSYAYHDWDASNQPDVATSLQQAVSEVHPGAIYLLHACSQTNATMLGDFIDQVRAAGYEFSSY